MSRKLRAALDRLAKAHAAVATALREDYPRGAPIQWKTGQTTQSGRVIAAMARRVRVRNDATGKVYFINATRIR